MPPNFVDQRVTLRHTLQRLTAIRMQRPYRDHILDDAPERLDFARCHAWLTTSYWSPGITRAEIERAFAHSTLVAGAYRGDAQTACLRVVSDLTRFAYLMDVFVEPSLRGQGIGKALVRFVLEHPDLALVYQWTLQTADAHDVYRAVGFEPVEHPGRWMALVRSRPWLPER